MLEREFGEKCIIMHFLAAEKDGKSRSLNAAALRKDLRKNRETKPACEVFG
jgi:hypothetical protein